MKKSKTEKAIIDLIEIRQLELGIEVANLLIETSNQITLKKVLKVARIYVRNIDRIAQLQRAKRIIEPKPAMAKGGIISKGEEVIRRTPYHKNPPPPTRPRGRTISKIEQRYIDELDY